MYNWIHEASSTFKFPFSIPTLVTRKVWCGEYKGNDLQHHSVYVIDYQFAEADKVVAICPDYKKWVQSSEADWTHLPDELELDKQNKLETSWFDEKIVCTPIMLVAREAIQLI